VEQQENQTLSSSIARNAIGLALFALVTAGVIGLVQVMSADRIATNIAEAQAKALYQITPKESVDNDLLNDVLPLTTAEAQKRFNLKLLGPIASDASVHFAKQNGELHTLILPAVAPDGYTTHISMLVGIKVDGTLAGVRIIEHRETPGLGDKVELKKSKWVLGFDGKSLTAPAADKWKVKKDGGEFDQFTGATITPRAVVNAVKKALHFYQQHKDALLAASAIADTAASADPSATEVTE